LSGSSYGIGRGCLEKIIENGGIAVGFDIKKSTKEHQNYRHYTVDVRDEAGIVCALEDIESQFSRIDALVNCAGVFSSSKLFYEMTSDEWNRVISTNLTGTFLMSKYLGLKMIKHRKGKIINISCMRSRIFKPNMADYAASKGGVVALTSAMALDLSGYNIQVNSIASGITLTGMTEKKYSNRDIKIQTENWIPSGRIADPKDIANVVLFLLSDLSEYINGETIFVDGGYSIFK
jgi:NAD(P)-dependent dehydrogenase (short-subunit alcohol dehydrogenase family)